MDTSVTKQGILRDASKDILKMLAVVAPKVLRRVGNKAKKRVADLAPKGETLRLSKSAKSTVKVQDQGRLVTLEVGVTDQKGHLFELGTIKMKRRPFVGPATKDLPQELEDEFRKELKKVRTSA